MNESLNEITEQIRSRIDIASLIGRDVKLRPSSRGYEGLCPFHNERTPSFHVYTDTQSFYCFGCHKGGDIFTYIMTRDNLTFGEALRELADEAGVTLTRSSGHGRSARDVLEMTAKFYADNLKGSSGNSARAYMTRRGVTESQMSSFGLGYALNSWDSLTLFLRKQGVSDKMMLELGLAVNGKHGLYDKFRGRVIFPIKDITGRAIAFGGRLIDGEGAKYMNSPDSPVYHKRENLYMMDVARKFIRERRRSILVEGYMDALRLHVCGFKETVASLGTSLTPEQAELLSRFSDRCCICYDSDTAGQNAALKSMYILQAHGLEVSVVTIPDGKDPDEFLIAHAPDEFEKLIAESKPLVLFHLSMLKSRLNDPASRKSALRELFEGLSSLSVSEVLEYRGELSESTRIIPSELEDILTRNRKHEDVVPVERQEPVHDEDNDLECALCSMLMTNEELRIHFPAGELSVLASPNARELGLSIMTEDVRSLNTMWLQTGDTEKLSMLERGRIACEQMPGDEYQKFMRIYSGLKNEAITRRMNEILSMPEAERDMQEYARLVTERMRYPK